LITDYRLLTRYGFSVHKLVIFTVEVKNKTIKYCSKVLELKWVYNLHVLALKQLYDIKVSDHKINKIGIANV